MAINKNQLRREDAQREAEKAAAAKRIVESEEGEEQEIDDDEMDTPPTYGTDDDEDDDYTEVEDGGEAEPEDGTKSEVPADSEQDDSASEGGTQEQSSDAKQGQQMVVLDKETVNNLRICVARLEEIEKVLSKRDEEIRTSLAKTEEYFKTIAEESTRAHKLAKSEKEGLMQAIGESSVEPINQLKEEISIMAEGVVDDALTRIDEVGKLAESHLRELDDEAMRRNKRFMEVTMPEKVMNYLKFVGIVFLASLAFGYVINMVQSML